MAFFQESLKHPLKAWFPGGFELIKKNPQHFFNLHLIQSPKSAKSHKILTPASRLTNKSMHFASSYLFLPYLHHCRLYTLRQINHDVQ